ncbi:MAG: elongation factor Ts [Christensenellaceae bacterium]|nr:elongation factor Ts [Christensenellaceae bacterium]
MANITTEMVKELRARTGAGMLDCKKALIEANGDVEKSIELLREKGLAQAAKKSGRIAAEGLVTAYVDEATKVGVIVEVNCETDFVANTDKFKDFCDNIAKHIVVAKPEYIRAEEAPEGYAGVCMMEQKFYNDDTKTVSDMLSDATVSIGEKIDIRRFSLFEYQSGNLDTYIHMGGKIGVLLQFACQTSCNDEEYLTFCHDIAMHVAASNPLYVKTSEVPENEIEREREILRVQAANENKPANIIERMVDGRLKKFYAEICLLEQPFVKNPDITVGKLMAALSKKLNDKIDIVKFVRYERGEGIEKRVNDLAAEVAAATQSK